MNEHNFRNQVNVIYGAPCEVIAAGENRNLVQAAIPPTKRKQDERTEIKQLERILSFGQALEKIKKHNSKKEKHISQAGIPSCKEAQKLKKLLDMGENL